MNQKYRKDKEKATAKKTQKKAKLVVDQADDMKKDKCIIITLKRITLINSHNWIILKIQLKFSILKFDHWLMEIGYKQKVK